MGKSPVFDILTGRKSVFPLSSSPLALVNVNLEQMDLVGSHYPDAFEDPPLMAKLAEAAYTIIGFEGIRIPFDLCVKAEAFGCAVKPASKNHPPSVLHPVFENPSQCLIPDGIFDKGRFHAVFEAVKLLQAKYSGRYLFMGESSVRLLWPDRCAIQVNF